jgi:GT2 family glycosyltransferase
MKLSIVIVNYNVKYLLEQCLFSVQKAIDLFRQEAEIIVVDNDSSDGSREYLPSVFKEVKFVFNNENDGFAKACNQGLKISSGNWVLFLNPDTLVPEDCFQKCILFFETHADAGAIGVRMVNGKNQFLKESKRGFPSPAASFYKLFGIASLFPGSKIFAKYYMGHLPEKENNPVDVLSGAFMMIKKEALQQTGGFDKSFFMYGEDIDLCYRISLAGFQNYYLGEITITHFKGRSTSYNYNQIITFYGAMNLFIKKHYRGKRSLLFIWALYTGVWLRKMMATAGLFFR